MELPDNIITEIERIDENLQNINIAYSNEIKKSVRYEIYSWASFLCGIFQFIAISYIIRTVPSLNTMFIVIVLITAIFSIYMGIRLLKLHSSCWEQIFKLANYEAAFIYRKSIITNYYDNPDFMNAMLLHRVSPRQ